MNQTGEQFCARSNARRIFPSDPGLTPIQRQVILGSLLGDACIMRVKPTHNAYIQMAHSIKQREYVEWKYNILKNIVSTPPKMIKNRGFGAGHMMVRFCTRSLPCITEIHDIIGSREITPQWMSEIADPIALAVWYQDDGSLWKCTNAKSSYVITFHTGDRDQTELKLLKSWMIDRFGLDHIAIYIPPKQPTATRLQIYADKTVRKFEKLVRPYIIPSMQYKLPPEVRSQCRARTPRK